MTADEIVTLVRVMSTLGVHKIRLTGGEPLLRHDVVSLVQSLARIPGIDDVAMTTNGSMLTQEKAEDLKRAGLNRITVSIDSLDVGRFGAINGVNFSPARVLNGIDNADRAGLSPVKINVVVKRNMNDEDILPLAEHFRFTGHTVRFIEFMDVGMSNRWSQKDVVPSTEILDRIASRWPLHPVDRDYYGEVAARYAYDDGGGELGLIASVTQPFCRDCTRARLSADGQLLLCLFGSQGVNLRDLIRHGATEQDLVTTIRDIWEGRIDRYSELRHGTVNKSGRLEMFRVGG